MAKPMRRTCRGGMAHPPSCGIGVSNDRSDRTSRFPARTGVRRGELHFLRRVSALAPPGVSAIVPPARRMSKLNAAMWTPAPAAIFCLACPRQLISARLLM